MLLLIPQMKIILTLKSQTFCPFYSHSFQFACNLHTQVDNMKFLEVLDVHAQCEKYILMMKNSVIFFFKY